MADGLIIAVSGARARIGYDRESRRLVRGNLARDGSVGIRYGSSTGFPKPIGVRNPVRVQIGIGSVQGISVSGRGNRMQRGGASVVSLIAGSARTYGFARSEPPDDVLQEMLARSGPRFRPKEIRLEFQLRIGMSERRSRARYRFEMLFRFFDYVLFGIRDVGRGRYGEIRTPPGGPLGNAEIVDVSVERRMAAVGVHTAHVERTVLVVIHGIGESGPAYVGTVDVEFQNARFPNERQVVPASRGYARSVCHSVRYSVPVVPIDVRPVNLGRPDSRRPEIVVGSENMAVRGVERIHPRVHREIARSELEIGARREGEVIARAVEIRGTSAELALDGGNLDVPVGRARKPRFRRIGENGRRVRTIRVQKQDRVVVPAVGIGKIARGKGLETGGRGMGKGALAEVYGK